MQFDILAWRQQQRLAIDLLTSKLSHALPGTEGAMTGAFIKEHHKKMWHESIHADHHYAENKYYTPPTRITAEAFIAQELPWHNATQNYSFIFSQAAPPPSATLNNNLMPQNDVAAIYGIKLLFGYSPDNSNNANNRTYVSSGPGGNDYSLYNSVCNLQIEDTTAIKNMAGQNFVDYGATGFSRSGMFYGAVPITPIRLISGKLGTFQFNVNLINPISTLTLTPNCVVRCELLMVEGQAKG